MAASRTVKRSAMRIGAALAALCLLLTLSPISVDMANAQEVLRRQTLFDRMFRRTPKQQELAPPTVNQRPQRGRSQNAPQRATPQRQGNREASPQRRAAPAAPKAPPIPVVTKSADAKVVLVIGDFIAGSAAEGLETLYISTADVRFDDRSKGSSGLVRQDYYNWEAQLKALLDDTKPSVVVVAIGSNDRQAMAVGDASLRLNSDEWLQEYRNRADRLTEILHTAKLPFLWIGLPPFRAPAMSADMLAFNSIQQEATKEAGGTFIDIWEGFVDENGTFTAKGPDVNGNAVALRGDDGINFTRAGKRKLAYYLEKPLSLLVGAPILPDNAIAPSLALLPMPSGPVGIDPATIDRTEPISLALPPLGPTNGLLGAPAQETEANPTFANPRKINPQPGRADYFLKP